MNNEELYTKIKNEVLIKHKIDLTHKDIIKVHCRALACHCECLGMNAENCQAMCADTKVPFGDSAYNLTLQKWGLINEEGKPII